MAGRQEMPVLFLFFLSLKLTIPDMPVLVPFLSSEKQLLS